MLIRFFMSRELEVLDPELSCHMALRQMRAHGHRRAPVVSKERLVGIVTDRDLLRILPATPAQGSEPGRDEQSGPRVREVMASDIVTVDLNAHIQDAAEQMLEHKIGGMPVLDGDQLVGMITESDLFRLVMGPSTSPGGTRLTLHWTRPDQEPQDPIPVCYETGARVLELTNVATPGGEPMLAIRVRCGDIERLLERLHVAGFALVERSDF